MSATLHAWFYLAVFADSISMLQCSLHKNADLIKVNVNFKSCYLPRWKCIWSKLPQRSSWDSQVANFVSIRTRGDYKHLGGELSREEWKLTVSSDVEGAEEETSAEISFLVNQNCLIFTTGFIYYRNCICCRAAQTESPEWEDTG